jgi:hypothetical protein
MARILVLGPVPNLAPILSIHSRLPAAVYPAAIVTMADNAVLLLFALNKGVAVAARGKIRLRIV